MALPEKRRSVQPHCSQSLELAAPCVDTVRNGKSPLPPESALLSYFGEG